MRISDWSSDVCSSDLGCQRFVASSARQQDRLDDRTGCKVALGIVDLLQRISGDQPVEGKKPLRPEFDQLRDQQLRSEEHTSELQSLMRISYAVFCLKKKKANIQNNVQTDF